jgi:long-chain acyl-CoA synthetase
MEVTRTFDLLDRYNELFDKDDALCAKVNGEWKKYSTKEYISYSHDFCYGMLALGISKGDKVITVSNNRPEWNFVDLGMAMTGIVHVPVFSSLNSAEYEHIITHSGARLVLISDSKLLKVIKPAVEKCGLSGYLYSFDPVNGIRNWIEIVELGRQNREKFRTEVENTKKIILPDDFATLIHRVQQELQRG